MNYLKSAFLFSILLAGAPLLHAEEQADVHPYLTQKYFLDTGVYFPDRTMRITVDGPAAGPSDIIDVHSEFGLDRSDETFSLNFGWRFGEKWQLGAQYFESSGAKQAVLDEDIDWGDFTFGQGSSVVVGTEFRLIRLFFARRFESREHHEFGLGVGIHWLELGAFIEGDVILSGGGNAFRRESASVSAPLPNIGAWYTYSISPKWALKARVDWLNADVGDYDGSLINSALGINYQMFDHAGVGLSYNFFDLDVGINSSGWRGNAQTIYEGLYVYVSFYW